ncbi:MAG: hypothetical protein AB8B47_03625 [Roseobacter sp.]
MLIWPHLALPISQAPIPMLILIAFIETRVLNMPNDKRQTVIDDDDMARVLDAFNFNAKRILTRIIARRALAEGELLLVVEQSELARVTPLTLVSVQTATPHPQVLDLDSEEISMIRDSLFDATVTAATLHLVTVRTRENLRSVSVDTSSISAHARMAALTAAQSVSHNQKVPT